jgi:4-hydroxy-3-methylbut-2-enyl diphosphate reductase
MTVDQNQTPVGTEEPESRLDPAVTASDQPNGTEPTEPTAATEALSSSDVPQVPEEAPIEQESAPVAESEPIAASAEPEAVETQIAETPTAESEPIAQVETPEVAAVVEASPEVEQEPAIVAAAEAEQVPAVVTTGETGGRAKPTDVDLFDSYMSAMDRGEDPEAAIDSGYKRLQKGDRIEATVIQVDRDRVFVDLGTKAEGIVPLGELSEDNLDTAKGLFNVGDKINVVVIRPEGAEGNPIVSKKRADFEETWDRIEGAFRSQEMITAQVVDRVKGGLVVDVGVRGFVPATHVGSGKLRNIEKFVGQPLQLKVIEIDRDRKKVVLSNRQAEEERRQNAKEEIFKNVKPGDILEGSVRRLTDYGAFVDLGGVDGLLHISEMSWARINHPKEMFREGLKIKVMVLRLDPGAGKISLGHRQVLPDPWNLIKQNYRIGQNLKITIGRIVQSGAFIKLPEGAEAFMPVSEMSYRRIKRPQDVVEENQEVEAQIIDLRPDERRMVLSMKAIGGGGEVRQSAPGDSPSSFDDGPRGKDRGKKGGKKGRGGRDYDDDFEESISRRGFATGGATIGERLGMLKGFLGRDEDEEEKPEEEHTEEHTEEEAAPGE